MPLQLVRNDIVNMPVDAIVNAANESLMGGGGVDGAIHRAAGPELDAACRALGGCATGDAKATPGFRLPAKYIIHTVGPVWRGGWLGEKKKLASCYRRSLEVARDLGCESIAFPLISTGAYGYPNAKALQTAVETISEFLLENDMTVYIVVFGRESVEVGGKLFRDIRSYIDDVYVETHQDDRSLRNQRAEMAQTRGPLVPNAAPPASHHAPRPSHAAPFPKPAIPHGPVSQDTIVPGASAPQKAFAPDSVQADTSLPQMPAAPAESASRKPSAPAPAESASRKPASPDLAHPESFHHAAASLDKILYEESDSVDVSSLQAAPSEAYGAGDLSMLAGQSLDDMLEQIDESFAETLIRKIDEKGITDAECYKRANIDRRLFNKIKNNPGYRPGKQTVLAFAIALELSLNETSDLLMKAGFALSHSSKSDIVVEYCILHKIYNIIEINEVLFGLDLQPLGY